ncbi:MAG: sodium-translocating pyrophosphatase [Phototrophicales bacterium]|nr:sodium-translocating pyrophosphatase [Phototrophicales bacterium]
MDFLTDNVTVASFIAIFASAVGLAFAWRQRAWVLAQDAGNEKMNKIATAIQRGAQAFLSREYRAIAILVVIVTIALILLGLIPGSGMSPWTALAFVTGAIASGTAGYGGMYIAVRANVRTTQAASKSLNQGLRVAFSSGTVMANLVVSLALLGIGVLFILFTNVLNLSPSVAASALAGFGFGGTSIAIFARVGGGIYTKAADVGADLVGKTELNIPEDSPQNPATIADNVGDNVGDVAGMGSDLFESYAGSIIAAITLALLGAGIAADKVIAAQVFPLLVAALGIFIGIASSFLVTTKEGATQEQLLWSLRKGVYGASLMVSVGIVALGLLLDLGWGVIIATLSGLIGGVLIGYFTEYFTSGSSKPTQELAASAEGGAGIIVIRGLALGMLSTLAPVTIVVIVTLLASWATGLYGVAIAAVGMLSTLGITLATDAYGPVADNAGGIAEMAQLGESVRDRTDALDSLGNTTAATGKGFAIGSAAMTALALMAAFITAIKGGDSATATTFAAVLLEPRLITGMFIGALLPFVFSAFSMLAVGKAAQEIVVEVKRQWREIPGLAEGTADPDYETCVAISTDSAIRQMILPGLIAVGVPVGIAILIIVGNGNIIGEFVGSETLVGVLMGSLITAFMLAIMMSNAGGAWDNAKKYIEAGNLKGVDANGNEVVYRKKSEPHKAAVVGDTVGDPFKDTAGPSLNILLKLVAIVALVLAPLIYNAIDANVIPTAGDTTTIEQPVTTVPESTPEVQIEIEVTPES